jgi:hypothetical protein
MPLSTEITSALTKAQGSSSSASAFGAAGGTVGDILKQKANEAFNDNQDIIKGLDTASANYFSAPATAREQYQNVWNPFEREKLASQYTQNQAIPMLSYGSVLGQRMGRIDDIIGSGTRAYDAETARRQAEAENAWNYYQSLVDEWKLEEDKRRYEQDRTDSLSGGGDLLSSLLAALTPQQEEQYNPDDNMSHGYPSLKDEPYPEPQFNYGEAIQSVIPSSVGNYVGNQSNYRLNPAASINPISGMVDWISTLFGGKKKDEKERSW